MLNKRRINLQKGEIATVIAIGTLLVVGISTFAASYFINKNKQTTVSKAAEPGNCRNDPEAPLKGYVWKADCNKPCVTNADCPKNTTDGSVNPETSNWCYYFATPGPRCLQLQRDPNTPVGITFDCWDGGRPRKEGFCEYGVTTEGETNEFAIDNPHYVFSGHYSECVQVDYTDTFPYGDCWYANRNVCRSKKPRGGCAAICNWENCANNNNVEKLTQQQYYDKYGNRPGDWKPKAGADYGTANPPSTGSSDGATQPGSPAQPESPEPGDGGVPDEAPIPDGDEQADATEKPCNFMLASDSRIHTYQHNEKFCDNNILKVCINGNVSISDDCNKKGATCNTNTKSCESTSPPQEPLNQGTIFIHYTKPRVCPSNGSSYTCEIHEVMLAAIANMGNIELRCYKWKDPYNAQGIFAGRAVKIADQWLWEGIFYKFRIEYYIPNNLKEIDLVCTDICSGDKCINIEEFSSFFE
jgi:hypothetical protein